MNYSELRVRYGTWSILVGFASDVIRSQWLAGKCSRNNVLLVHPCHNVEKGKSNSYIPCEAFILPGIILWDLFGA